jgi:hypothetical protein
MFVQYMSNKLCIFIWIVYMDCKLAQERNLHELFKTELYHSGNIGRTLSECFVHHDTNNVRMS